MPTSSTAASTPICRELHDHELPTILPLIGQLNPGIDATTLAARLGRMRGSGYRCAGAFGPDGALIGVCGFWMMTRFWCGSSVDLDNVVVDAAWRGRGVGERLCAWVEDLARADGCESAVLDAYVGNSGAHRFYLRAGYDIAGFHFKKALR